MAELNVLVVGGGIAGMTSAIALRRLGVAVDIIDLDPEWRVYGAGITITRPTMRAFRDIGLLDELLEVGCPGDGIRICRKDGTAIDWVQDPEIPGDPLPGSGGVMRPELHRILSRHVVESGASVRLGLTVDRFEQDADGIDVRFSDGSAGRYDLMIGADGVYSKVRGLLFPNAEQPQYTGQSIWRLHAPRPAGIDRRHFFLGGDVKIGLCPVSATHLYMFLLETTPIRPIIPDEELYRELGRMMEGYGGAIAELREGLRPDSIIVVRPLEAFLLPPPWHRGRALLIGDAAHPTTPQLASGAGIAVEDSIVLAQELTRAQGDVPATLDAFMRRRWDRCRLVVENSIQIGRLEQRGAAIGEQTRLVAESLAALAAPL